MGKPTRMPCAATAATIGLTFAGMLILQDTRARLLGYDENAKEVNKFGMWPEQPSKVEQMDKRFPTAAGNFTATAIKPPLEWKNHD